MQYPGDSQAKDNILLSYYRDVANFWKKNKERNRLFPKRWFVLTGYSSSLEGEKIGGDLRRITQELQIPQEFVTAIDINPKAATLARKEFPKVKIITDSVENYLSKVNLENYGMIHLDFCGNLNNSSPNEAANYVFQRSSVTDLLITITPRADGISGLQKEEARRARYEKLEKNCKFISQNPFYEISPSYSDKLISKLCLCSFERILYGKRKSCFLCGISRLTGFTYQRAAGCSVMYVMCYHIK